MRRTEDELRKDRWVDRFFLACFCILGSTMMALLVRDLCQR